jgi:hypothetical protein
MNSKDDLDPLTPSRWKAPASITASRALTLSAWPLTHKKSRPLAGRLANGAGSAGGRAWRQNQKLWVPVHFCV